MKPIIKALLVLVLLLTATEAFARPHGKHRHHHRHHISRVAVDANANAVFSFGSSSLVSRIRRDAGTNPIGWAHRWCGRYLRSVVSNDPGPAFNVAAKWRSYGSATTAQVGAIGVMWGHVGVIAAIEGNRVLLVSGNHGHVVGEGWYPISRFIAFRTA